MDTRKWSRWVLGGGVVLALLLIGCATRTAHAPVEGEKFRVDALVVERVYVVLSFPAAYKERIGEPLKPALAMA